MSKFYQYPAIVDIVKTSQYRRLLNWLQFTLSNPPISLQGQHCMPSASDALLYIDIIKDRYEFNSVQKQSLIDICNEYIASIDTVMQFSDLKAGMFFKSKDGRTYVILYGDSVWFKCFDMTTCGSESSWSAQGFDLIESWSYSYEGQYKTINH
jgi:hypothetical protein